MTLLACRHCEGLTLKLYGDRCKACMVSLLLMVPKDEVVARMVEKMSEAL